jgi:hypothetical protein
MSMKNNYSVLQTLEKQIRRVFLIRKSNQSWDLKELSHNSYYVKKLKL